MHYHLCAAALEPHMMHDYKIVKNGCIHNDLRLQKLCAQILYRNVRYIKTHFIYCKILF